MTQVKNTTNQEEKDIPLTSNERVQVALSMREYLSRKVSNNVWGAGFLFESEDKKLNRQYKKIDRENDLLTLFSFVEREISKHGRAIILMVKNTDGEVRLNVPSPYLFQGVGKALITPVLAVIWQRLTIDTQNYLVKSTYDKKRCVTELYGFGDDGKQIVRVMDKMVELEALGFVELWEHNLGFVPVFEITNLPLRQYQFNNAEFESLADWFPAKRYEGLMYDTIVNLQKELWYCHSRIQVENAGQEVVEKIRTQAISVSGETIQPNFFDDYIIETETGAKMTAISGNGDFLKYSALINEIMDLYCKLANTSRFSEGGGAQKTTAESGQIRSSLIEATTQKIRLRQRVYGDMLFKLFVANDLLSMDDIDGDEKFIFKIYGNIVEDPTTKLDNELKLVQIGADSIIDLIKSVYKCDTATATARFDRVKEFNEKEDIMTALSIGGGANIPIDDGDGGDGAPTKKENTGEDSDK